MSLQEIAALARRHLAAVVAVGFVALCVALYFKHTPVNYQESCTIVLTPPVSATSPNPYGAFDGSLTETAGTMALLLMSPRSQQQVRAAGGESDFNVALVNTGNLSAPDFGPPDVIVTATSADPVGVHRTFTIVIQLFEHDLATAQANTHATLASQIGAHVVGDTGTVAVPGSSKRVYAGLLVLTIVAALSVASFLDRHRFRLSLPALQLVQGRRRHREA